MQKIVLAAVGRLVRRSHSRHRAGHITPAAAPSGELAARQRARAYHPAVRPLSDAESADFAEHANQALALVADQAGRCGCHGLQQCPGARSGRLYLVGGAR